MSLTSDFLKGSIGPGFDAETMTAALEALDRQVFDPLTKGFPPAHAPLTLGDIANHTWNLLAGDLTAPVAVLPSASNALRSSSSLPNVNSVMTSFVSRRSSIR